MPASLRSESHLLVLARRVALGLPLFPADTPPPPPPPPGRELPPAPPHGPGGLPHARPDLTRDQLRAWDRLRKRAERALRHARPHEDFLWLLVVDGVPRGLVRARTRYEAYRLARKAAGRHECGRGLWPGATMRLVRPAGEEDQTNGRAAGAPRPDQQDQGRQEIPPGDGRP